MDLLLIGILPIVLYAFIEWKFGSRAGVWAAMILGVAIAMWISVKMQAQGQSADEFLWVELGLIVILGLVSLKTKNELYFKMQPAIVGVIISVYLVVLEIFFEPVLLHYIPMMQALDPSKAALFTEPRQQQLMVDISRAMLVFFPLHTVAVAWAALKASTNTWVLVRLSWMPGMFILAMLVGVLSR